MQLYLYLLSKLGPEGPADTSRNPLLLNKGGDNLADKRYPADWWRAPDKRGYKQVDGRWTYPVK